MKITYFVHSATTDNERGIATGWLPGELSALGVKQAAELMRLIKGKTYDPIFCSDLQRAVDSARLFFGSHAEIIRDARLRECNYGNLNGSPEVQLHKLEHLQNPFPGGESYSHVERRIKSFLEELKVRYAGSYIAIVSHQAPQLALEVLLNGKSWPQAFSEDWRNTDAWQPGWEYPF